MAVPLVWFAFFVLTGCGGGGQTANVDNSSAPVPTTAGGDSTTVTETPETPTTDLPPVPSTAVATTTTIAPTVPSPVLESEFEVEKEDESIFVTVVGVSRVPGTAFCSEPGITRACEDFDPMVADVILVETSIRNEFDMSLDLTCGYPIRHGLLDGQNRELSSTGALYQIAGNPECNSRLNPGFQSLMTYSYPIPTGASFSGWMFSNAQGDRQEVVFRLNE